MPIPLKVTLSNGTKEQVTADHILIATGGRPYRPNIKGQEFGIDSDGFFALTELPNALLLLGLAILPLNFLVY